jgi:hypothetical protein
MAKFALLNGKFSHWNMSILRPAKRVEDDLKANWKVVRAPNTDHSPTLPLDLKCPWQMARDR